MLTILEQVTELNLTIMESSYSIFADFDLSGPVAGPIHGGVETVVCSEVEVDLRAVKG